MKSKLFSVGKILLGIVFCLIVSACIYLGSTIFVFGAWHCPHGNCQTATWINVVIFLIFVSPLLIFSIGAYLCCDAVYALTDSKYLRMFVFLAFSLFPLCIFTGLIVYAVISRN